MKGVRVSYCRILGDLKVHARPQSLTDALREAGQVTQELTS